MKTLGSNELLADVFDKDLCVGCGACVGLCPYFKTYKGKTVMVFPCTRSEGRCFAYCPKVEVDLDILANEYWGHDYNGEPLGDYREIVMAKAGPKMPRGNFQTGGTVSALVSAAMDYGLINSAVMTDREGLIPVPRLVQSVNEIIGCASSKYMASPTLSAFNKAVSEGETDIGLVVTPCQATAVAQMRLNPLHQKEFVDPVSLVVGLFCTWALDTRGLVELMKRHTDLTKVKKMHIPPPPAEKLCLETNNGGVEVCLTEIRQLVPAGCNVCPDMTSEWADISVGEVEGQREWNTLIIRTERGQVLVGRAIKDGWIETKNMPEQNFENLTIASRNKKKRAYDRVKEKCALNTGKEGARSIFRVKKT
jgi:coenzyme F420 hydrogenase subunit beta